MPKPTQDEKYFITLSKIDYYGYLISSTHKHLGETKTIRSPLERAIDRACNFNRDKMESEQIAKSIIHAARQRIRLKKQINADCRLEQKLIEEIKKHLSKEIKK